MIIEPRDENIATVITALKLEAPNSSYGIRKAFKKHGVAHKLKKVGGGAFREVFAVGNLPIVIKVPYYGDNHHANQEIKALKKLHAKKYHVLHEFLPRVYFHDKKSGLIVMKKYEKPKKEDCSASNVLEKIVCTLFNHTWCDLKPDNMGVIRHMWEPTKYVIVDLGCFYEGDD